MKIGFERGFCIVLIVLLLFAFAIPVAAMAGDVIAVREFDGEAKEWEKVKPDKPPGKPPKPGDDDGGAPDLSVYNKMAVVIGIADYRGKSNDLQYTDDDAVDMYNYLISRNWPASNIKLLLDKQATANKIMNAIDWMAQYEKSDTECVFFYSGHGGTYSGGIDTYDPNGVDEGIISHDLYIILDDTLASKFATYDTNKLAFMFDSCHSGGMDDLIGGKSGRVMSAPCLATQYSYDGTSSMQNGVWTYFLMAGLAKYHTVEEAHTYAASNTNDDFVGEDNAPDWVKVNYGPTMTPVMVDSYTGNWAF
jgi:hypothetical protein